MGVDSLNQYGGGGDPTHLDDRILSRWLEGDPEAIRLATKRYRPELSPTQCEEVVNRIQFCTRLGQNGQADVA